MSQDATITDLLETRQLVNQVGNVLREKNGYEQFGYDAAAGMFYAGAPDRLIHDETFLGLLTKWAAAQTNPQNSEK